MLQTQSNVSMIWMAMLDFTCVVFFLLCIQLYKSFTPENFWIYDNATYELPLWLHTILPSNDFMYLHKGIS